MTDDLIEPMCKAFAEHSGEAKWPDDFEPVERDLVRGGMRAGWAVAAEPTEAMVVAVVGRFVAGDFLAWKEARQKAVKDWKAMHGAADGK